MGPPDMGVGRTEERPTNSLIPKIITESVPPDTDKADLAGDR